MSFVRICASIPAVLVACAIGSAGLGGCYDLSTTGPRPEDFVRDRSETAPKEQPQTEARPADPTAIDRSGALIEAFAAEPAPAPEADDEAPEVQRVTPPR